MIQRTLHTLTATLVLAWVALAFAQDRPATIADAIRAEPSLTEFADLLDQTGLLGHLGAPGRFTFFAPSDRAWSTIDARVLRDLRRDRGALEGVVRHHLVIGASPLRALRRLDAVTTLQTTRLLVHRTGDDVRVAGVRLANEGIETGNGVLYVVDRVLIPDASYMIKDLLASPGR
ncbi:MAG: fasciclin domain-containing protein [Trueperaceae bacterium]